MLALALLINTLFYIAIICIPIAGIITFIILKKNKKVYICSVCGGVSKFEQMEAKSCSVCGGKLVEIKSKDINNYLSEYKNRFF